MSDTKSLKRSREEEEEEEEEKVTENVNTGESDMPRIHKKCKRELQVKTAAAALQEAMVHVGDMNQKTSMEVLKVAVVTIKKLLDNDPDILRDFTDDQCRIIAHVSKTILKNQRLKSLKKRSTFQKPKFRNQPKKSCWWRCFWPL